MRPLYTPLLLISLSIRLASGASPAPQPTAPAQVQELPVSPTIPKYTTTNIATNADEAALAEAVPRQRQLRARRIKTEVAASAYNDNAIVVVQEHKLAVVPPPTFHPALGLIAALLSLFTAFLLIMMVSTTTSARGVLPRRPHSDMLLPEYAPLSQRYQSPMRRHQVNTLHALTPEAAASLDAPTASNFENEQMIHVTDSTIPNQGVLFEHYNDSEDRQVLTDVVQAYILHVRMRRTMSPNTRHVASLPPAIDASQMCRMYASLGLLVCHGTGILEEEPNITTMDSVEHPSDGQYLSLIHI